MDKDNILVNELCDDLKNRLTQGCSLSEIKLAVIQAGLIYIENRDDPSQDRAVLCQFFNFSTQAKKSINDRVKNR